MELFAKNIFTDEICDQFVLDINRSKSIMPLVHPCKWKENNVYYHIFEIKSEVLQSISKCKYRPTNKIESKEDLKKLLNLLYFLNKETESACIYLRSLYNKYELYFPNK